MSPKGGSSKYASLGQGGAGVRVWGAGRGDKMLRVAVLAFSCGATSAFWEQLAGCSPSLSPSLSWFLVFLLLCPPFPGVEREDGQQRSSDCSMAHPAASLGCRLWLVFWKWWGISAEQVTSSPDLLWPAGKSCLHNPERLLKGSAGFERRGHFCWKAFSLPSWLNGHHFLFYSFILCPYYLLPLSIESPNNWAGQMLSFPWWPEIDSRDALGPLKETELALQYKRLKWPSQDCRP